MATLGVTSNKLSLDQLVALCDEIAALARAGVPLDHGLTALGHDLPGRLGRVAREMGSELAAGTPLDHVVARADGQFPPGFQAMLQAGIRAGNLPGILQGIAQLARRTGELRKQLFLAAINPLAVAVITYLLFLFWLDKLAPVYLLMCADWDMNTGPAEAIVTALQQWQWLWGPLIPVLGAVLVYLTWRGAGTSSGDWSLLDCFTFGIVGGIGRMRRAGQYASLCEQLAILLEHGLPLAESLQLISATIRSQPLAQATRQFAEQLARGETVRPPQPFPPLVACMLFDHYSQRELIVNLRQLAANYYDEVRRRSAWLTTWVPAILSLCIGGVLVLFHGLITLGPWLLLMKHMGDTA
ncbi:Putative type II secretion system protein F [Anatilimnocola aggregata]|uniref:Type II secretion system protein F n=1 Tax=Anatilimnocola aggregata TaxID=2528021 RepID=A0A517YHZ4_9BACT|nr:type II secretion system F family protein [Anatilimnocola aggregata]QDU29853.1 Putative type II secretion system protein F [Anatilimnocola aggregata]